MSVKIVDKLSIVQKDTIMINTRPVISFNEYIVRTSSSIHPSVAFQFPLLTVKNGWMATFQSFGHGCSYLLYDQNGISGCKKIE